MSNHADPTLRIFRLRAPHLCVSKNYCKKKLSSFGPGCRHTPQECDAERPGCFNPASTQMTCGRGGRLRRFFPLLLIIVLPCLLLVTAILFLLLVSRGVVAGGGLTR